MTNLGTGREFPGGTGVTIYGTLLAKGYFPKELPPAFSTDIFARYATSKQGREALDKYKPTDNFTELVRYRLAIPGNRGLETRPLSIPHPWAYSALARVIAKNFRRLLKKAAASGFSKSRPVFGPHLNRALRPLVRPSNLARERAKARAGATHLLRADISQFYPALYTHAVGWAIDQKLRQRSSWTNTKLLGKKIDARLMNMQGKLSQGIPIGNDLSFLLAEVVLAQVDKSLNLPPWQAYRWYDDYEIACRSRQEAEEVLCRLRHSLDSFRLRVNPKKTTILELPESASDDWQDELRSASARALATPQAMVAYFDRAFRARFRHPDQPVLLYAMATLFKAARPREQVRQVAQSCITQALLSEPGCAQKAFSLLTYWELNGAQFDRPILSRTIDTLTKLHESREVSSDIAWALAFCIQHSLVLPRQAAVALSDTADDVVALLALHANALGLLPGFHKRSLLRLLHDASPDGQHWLLLFESVRQGYLPTLAPCVAGNALLGDLLKRNVAFYRGQLPTYAVLVHPGGAPTWLVSAWLDAAVATSEQEIKVEAIVGLIRGDADSAGAADTPITELVRRLLDLHDDQPTESLEPYF